MLKHIARHLLADKVNGKKYFAGGLKKHKKDERDFKYPMGVSLLGYTPKQSRLIIQTVSIKDQAPDNTCTQESVTAQKECDEGVELSEEGATCAAVEVKVVSGNGFSTLRDMQQVVQKVGLPEKRLLNLTHVVGWAAYSNPKNLTPEIRENALLHKSQSYFLCNNRDERLKALDDGRTLHAGMDWFSEYNVSSGFAAPWLIIAPGKVYKIGGDNSGTVNTNFVVQMLVLLKDICKALFSKFLGGLVGGHALLMIGYDLNYNGRKVYIIQNSYGPYWGDKGKFYVDMDMYDRYGDACYAQVDITVDVAYFLNNHNWSFVKSDNSLKKSVYQIIGDTKYPFENWVTFLAYNGTKSQIEEVADSILENIKTGEAMDIKAAPGYEMLRELVQPDNYKLVMDAAKF